MTKMNQHLHTHVFQKYAYDTYTKYSNLSYGIIYTQKCPKLSYDRIYILDQRHESWIGDVVLGTQVNEFVIQV